MGHRLLRSVGGAHHRETFRAVGTDGPESDPALMFWVRVGRAERVLFSAAREIGLPRFREHVALKKGRAGWEPVDIILLYIIVILIGHTNYVQRAIRPIGCVIKQKQNKIIVEQLTNNDVSGRSTLTIS